MRLEDIDLADPEFYVDGVPHEAFALLRKEAPVHWLPEPDGGPGFWAVTRHDDIVHVSKHPELIVHRDGYLEIARMGDRCAALTGEIQSGFACAIYEQRPAPCREFELGGEHCLTARRRTGLSL